ncbi:condensation domain-containing protein [Streptomyces gobiensis]|uniref:condensation domain-containing protein n=1 Tax=Streptomyces gobiensis TaxID=2875706 RepID=UPI001E490BD9|nr:condensation domain-containing protein [Streptomyces gobiensis]UGY91522.1 condensation domain-containing protein [Streptomyces gobiensis]
MRRRLSPTERLVWAASEVLPVNIAVISRVRGRTTPNLLRAALAAARRRHPLLGVRIADPGRWQAWLTTEAVPDPELRVIKASTPDCWRHAVEEELSRPFQASTGPLSRFVMVDAGDSFDLIGVYHHLVADGISGCFVLRDLLRWLTDPTSADMTPVVAAPADDLLPDCRARLTDLVKAARMVRGGGRPTAPQGPLTFACWSLDARETAALLSRCRSEGSSLQAALCAAFARAFTDLGCPATASITVPVDLRRILTPAAGEAVGLYASAFRLRVNGNDQYDFWDTARSVRADIQRHLRPEELISLIRGWRLLPFLSRRTMGALLRRSETKRSLCDFSISNMRPPIAVDYGALRVTGLYGAGHTSLSGTPLVALFGIDGQLFFGVTSKSGAYAQELCDRATLHLGNAVSATPAPGTPGLPVS